MGARVGPGHVCELGAHAKFQNPTITTSGRKVTRGEKEESKKRKNAVYSGQYVLLHGQGQSTHLVWTKIMLVSFDPSNIMQEHAQLTTVPLLNPKYFMLQYCDSSVLW